jgi:predicted metal-binding protein
MNGDHAPVGEVAFRAESYDLLNSASYLWAEATTAPLDKAELLVSAAQWYEGLACTLDEIRNLPEKRNDALLKRIRRYTD